MRLPDPTQLLRDPWTPVFNTISVGGAALAAGVVAIRGGGDAPWSLAVAVGAALCGALGWNRLNQAPTATTGSLWLLGGLTVALAGAAVVGALGDVWSTAVIVLPFLLIWLSARTAAHSALRTYLLIPLLFGLICLGAAVLTGNLGAGGFPAALALFLSFVLHATRRIEHHTEVPADPANHPEVHRIHRGTLARISIVFFLFGVICLWPWLGKIYSNAYFWIMLAGVLMPIMLYWGRLRQPRAETSYQALVRFNRLAPYLALVLMLALIVG